MKIGVIEYIDSAHYLPGHPKCGNLHGHTYRVEVIIEGEHKDGMVMDFADLKKIVRATLEEFDHKLLNDILEFPSIENICLAIKQKLTLNLPFPFTLRVWEGHNKWAEL